MGIQLHLNPIDDEISKERLKKLQKHLFRHQTNKNRSFEGKSVDVIVENKMRDQQKLFGRNKYLNSVIFHGDINDIGKMLKVKIESTNSNTLFGKVENNNEIRVI